MDKFQAKIDEKWAAVDAPPGAERWLRQETEPAEANGNALTAPKTMLAASRLPVPPQKGKTGHIRAFAASVGETAHASYAPLTRWQMAVLVVLCVLGVLVTAAVGLLFVFWSYLQ